MARWSSASLLAPVGVEIRVQGLDRGAVEGFQLALSRLGQTVFGISGGEGLIHLVQLLAHLRAVAGKFAVQLGLDLCAVNFLAAVAPGAQKGGFSLEAETFAVVLIDLELQRAEAAQIGRFDPASLNQTQIVALEQQGRKLGAEAVGLLAQGFIIRMRD